MQSAGPNQIHLNTDEWYFDLEWIDHANIGDLSEPADFVRRVEGEILAIHLDTGERRVVGKFQLYYLDIELAWRHNVLPYDVFDVHERTMAFYEYFFDSDDIGCFRGELQELFGREPYQHNVLIFDRLEILPQYRGSALGLLSIKALMQRFGTGAAYAAIKVFPLQAESGPRSGSDAWLHTLQLEQFDGNVDRAATRLVRYYAKMGFRAYIPSPFMFYAMRVPLPSTKQIELIAKKRHTR